MNIIYKVIIIIFAIFLTSMPVSADRKYYIKIDTDYDLKFLCFNDNECYNINLDIIDIKNKKFVGFGRHHYFDVSTYKYDKSTNTYSVDILVDRDPTTDLGICNKCPYDKGNITHLVFSLIYKPSSKEFKATYKGFVSSEDIVQYKDSKPTAIQVNYLNIYYDKNSKYIEDLSDWLKFFNNEIAKTIEDSYGYIYDVELKYIIPYYLL